MSVVEDTRQDASLLLCEDVPAPPGIFGAGNPAVPSGTGSTAVRQHARSRSVMGAVGNTVSMIMLGISVLAALVLIVVPVLTGSQTYLVLTNSMAPAYPPGTFIVVQPTEFDTLVGGDVITYQIESGQPEVMTHRITGLATGQDGERLLITQGDNNDVADPEPVMEAQVRGELLYAVPYVGFLANVLGNSDRGMAVNIIAVLTIGWGVVTMARGFAASRRGSEASTTAEQSPATAGTAAEGAEPEDTEDPVHGRQHTNLGGRP